MRASLGATFVLSFVLSLARASLAGAEPDPCDHDVSVSPEREARASALTDRAFAEHAKLNYDEAATLYVEALEHWDRPDIHRHAGMAYFYGAQLLKAYHYLSESLRCGRAWIEPDDYKEAEILMQRLRPWFAEIEVHVPNNEVRATFDGESWFAGEGKHRRVVVVGQHVVKVEKPGHVPVSKLLFVSPGERAVVTPILLPKSDEIIVARRWQRWKPWAIFGAGAAAGLIGAGLGWSAFAQANRVEQDLVQLCDNPSGCTTGDDQSALHPSMDAATLKNRLAIGAFAVGGLAAAAGVTLLVLNRPRKQRHPDAGRAKLRVEPMISPAKVGVSVGMRFD